MLQDIDDGSSMIQGQQVVVSQNELDMSALTVEQQVAVSQNELNVSGLTVEQQVAVGQNDLDVSGLTVEQQVARLVGAVESEEEEMTSQEVGQGEQASDGTLDVLQQAAGAEGISEPLVLQQEDLQNGGQYGDNDQILGLAAPQTQLVQVNTGNQASQDQNSLITLVLIPWLLYAFIICYIYVI